MTQRQPAPPCVDNSLAGVDFQYRNTRLPGGRSLETDVFYQQSDTDGRDGRRFFVRHERARSRALKGCVARCSTKEYEQQFNPGLGFLDSPGISDTYMNVGYMLRPSGGRLESWLANFDYQRIDYLDGGLKTEAFFFRPLDARESHRRSVHARVRRFHGNG